MKMDSWTQVTKPDAPRVMNPFHVCPLTFLENEELPSLFPLFLFLLSKYKNPLKNEVKSYHLSCCGNQKSKFKYKSGVRI